MPRTIGDRPVATEQELLDFANAIRRAGGADVLEALLPSVPANPERCLIANAMNFGCRVGGLDKSRDGDQFAEDKDGNQPWFMMFPDNMEVDRIREIAKQVPGARFAWGWELGAERIPALRLPQHIGNAAYAFDNGAAFQEYAKRNQ